MHSKGQSNELTSFLMNTAELKITLLIFVIIISVVSGSRQLILLAENDDMVHTMDKDG